MKDMKEMKDLTHRRHDLSDRAWEILTPLLPGRKGSWGGKAKDNRLFLNAVQVDCLDGRFMARPATRLRRLEKHPPQVQPVERQGYLEAEPRHIDGGA